MPKSESVTAAGDELPAPAVDDLEAVGRPGHVGVLAVLDLADDPAQRDLLAGPIGRPVGVEVGAGRQPLRDLVRHAQARAGHVGAVEDQVVQRGVRARAACPRPVSSDAVGAGLRLEDDLVAVGDEHAGPGAAPCPSSCPGRRRAPARATS